MPDPSADATTLESWASAHGFTPSERGLQGETPLLRQGLVDVATDVHEGELDGRPARVFNLYVDAAGMSKVRVAGEDKFAFEFGGGMYNVDAQVIVPRFGPVPIPMKAMGYGFYVAHNKDRLGAPSGAGAGGSTVKVERDKRGAYPILFDFIYADRGTESNASVSDSTDFKLVHKPKASAAPPAKEEPRTPIKPNRRIRRNR